jgi:CHAT domain-containing protein
MYRIEKFVIDEFEVHMVSSIKDLLTSSKASKSTINDATLFGYPNFNSSNTIQPDSSRGLFTRDFTLRIKAKKEISKRFLNGENINELPGTKIEVESIGDLLQEKGIPTKQYMFDKANESEIKKLQNPQILHIATHGFFLSDLTQAQNNYSFAGMEVERFIENPLLRSGLLFAGVKNTFNSSGLENESFGDEDGILTAYEAMNLDLNQTDLVVLSACETGLGITKNGEGVYGLQRAFQVAGAKSVLMSLWTVSDEATQQLMTQFYNSWLEVKSAREAFRLTQISLRFKYPEPYYWGAFVMIGK